MGRPAVILSGAKDRVGGARDPRASLACIGRSFAPLRMTWALLAVLGLATAPLAAQAPATPKPKPPQTAPKPAPIAPAPVATAQRCTFQIDNVDRQGAVNETPTGTNYFAGGNVRLSCRGSQIRMQSDS